ncbi:Remorin, C-terminal [Sesbania bispinosa]|nr:Remorin, C-terminal [Sesbania bispinosa]
MLNDPTSSTTHRSEDDQEEDEQIREIHALTHLALHLLLFPLTTVVVEEKLGKHIATGHLLCLWLAQKDLMEETNPLAIVPDNHPLDPVPSPGRVAGPRGSGGEEQVSVQRVKKEEVDTKISAWQNAKVAKINNRFKREDAVINGWESEQVQKATSWMKKVERKLEEKRARALEKMQNEIAKAHRKAEERRASAEAKRGTKVARVLEIAGLMKAVGRAPAKKSFF